MQEIYEVVRARDREFMFSEKPLQGDPKNIVYALKSMVRTIRAQTTTPETWYARHENSYLKTAKIVERSHQNYIKYWSHFPPYFRVLCLSTNSDDEYMWSEYAEMGKDICMKIDTSLLNLPLNRLNRVTYQNDPAHQVEILEVVDSIIGISNIDMIKRIARLCFVKEEKWKAENEWRCVLLRSDWNRHPLRNSPKVGLYDDLKFNANAIEKIKFGKNCENKFKESIGKIVTENFPTTMIENF